MKRRVSIQEAAMTHCTRERDAELVMRFTWLATAREVFCARVCARFHGEVWRGLSRRHHRAWHAACRPCAACQIV